MNKLTHWLSDEEHTLPVNPDAREALKQQLFPPRKRSIFLVLTSATIAVGFFAVAAITAPGRNLLTAENALANAIGNMSSAQGNDLALVRKTTTTNAGTTVEEVITDGTRYLVSLTDEQGVSFMPDWYEKNADGLTLTRYSYNQGILERHLEGDYAHRNDERAPEAQPRSWVPTPDLELVGFTPGDTRMTWQQCDEGTCEEPIGISSTLLRNADSMDMKETTVDGRTLLTITTDLKQPDIILTHVIDRDIDKLVKMQTGSKENGVQMVAEFAYESLPREHVAIDFSFEGWVRAVAADVSETKVACFAYDYACDAEETPPLYFPEGWKEDARFN